MQCTSTRRGDRVRGEKWDIVHSIQSSLSHCTHLINPGAADAIAVHFGFAQLLLTELRRGFYHHVQGFAVTFCDSLQGLVVVLFSVSRKRKWPLREL